jgi:hypothetical protein
MGAWMIISPWVVGTSPDTGVVVNSIVIGALAVVLGMLCAVTTMRGPTRT